MQVSLRPLLPASLLLSLASSALAQSVVLSSGSPSPTFNLFSQMMALDTAALYAMESVEKVAFHTDSASWSTGTHFFDGDTVNFERMDSNPASLPLFETADIALIGGAPGSLQQFLLQDPTLLTIFETNSSSFPQTAQMTSTGYGNGLAGVTFAHSSPADGVAFQSDHSRFLVFQTVNASGNPLNEYLFALDAGESAIPEYDDLFIYASFSVDPVPEPRLVGFLGGAFLFLWLGIRRFFRRAG
jgi:hypothetical protein